MSVDVPYYHRSLDWDDLVHKHPPAPLYGETVGQLSDDEMRKFQEKLFAEKMTAAWDVSFFAKRWRDAGIEPGDIKSLDDLRHLPVYDSEDTMEAIAESPPFGSHHPPRSEFGRVPLKIQTSGGTTGFPKVSLFDPLAWEVQAIQAARGMWAFGMRPGDIALIPHTLGLGNAPWLLYKACHDWLGVVPITPGSGVVMPTERQLELARVWGVNAWIGDSEYFGYVIEVANSIGFDLASLGTKLVKSYLGFDPEARRKVLEDAFQAPASDGWGSHEIGEVACECLVRNGLHVYEDTVFIEIVDPHTGAPVGEGTPGTAVVTSLHRTVPPVIRYDMRDILIAYPRETCECGVRSSKLSHLQGRADEMVKVRGTNVFPRAVESVIRADQRCSGEYLCVATTAAKGAVGTTEMTIRVERAGDDIDATTLADALAPALKTTLGVRVGVEVVDRGELADVTGYGKGEQKIKRLLDLR